MARRNYDTSIDPEAIQGGMAPEKLIPVSEEARIRSAGAGYEALANGVKGIGQIVQGINDFNRRSYVLEEEGNQKDVYIDRALDLDKRAIAADLEMRNDVAQKAIKLQVEADEALADSARFKGDPVAAVDKVFSKSEYGDTVYADSPEAQQMFQNARANIYGNTTRAAVSSKYQIEAATAENNLNYLVVRAKEFFTSNPGQNPIEYVNGVFTKQMAPFADAVGVQGQINYSSIAYNAMYTSAIDGLLSEVLEGTKTVDEAKSRLKELDAQFPSTAQIQVTKNGQVIKDQKPYIFLSDESKRLRDRIYARLSTAKGKDEYDYEEAFNIVKADYEAYTSRRAPYVAGQYSRAVEANKTFKGDKQIGNSVLLGKIMATELLHTDMNIHSEEEYNNCLSQLADYLTVLEQALSAGGTDALNKELANRAPRFITKLDGATVDIRPVLYGYISQNGKVKELTKAFASGILTGLSEGMHNYTYSYGDGLIQDKSIQRGFVDVEARLKSPSARKGTWTSEDLRKLTTQMTETGRRAGRDFGATGIASPQRINAIFTQAKDEGKTSHLLNLIMYCDACDINGAHSRDTAGYRQTYDYIARNIYKDDAATSNIMMAVAMMPTEDRAALKQMLSDPDKAGGGLATNIYSFLASGKVDSNQVNAGEITGSPSQYLAKLQKSVTDTYGVPIEDARAVVIAAAGSKFIASGGAWYDLNTLDINDKSIKEVVRRNYVDCKGKKKMSKNNLLLRSWGENYAKVYTDKLHNIKPVLDKAGLDYVFSDTAGIKIVSKANGSDTGIHVPKHMLQPPTSAPYQREALHSAELTSQWLLDKMIIQDHKLVNAIPLGTDRQVISTAYSNRTNLPSDNTTEWVRLARHHAKILEDPIRYRRALMGERVDDGTVVVFHTNRGDSGLVTLRRVPEYVSDAFYGMMHGKYQYTHSAVISGMRHSDRRYTQSVDYNLQRKVDPAYTRAGGIYRVDTSRALINRILPGRKGTTTGQAAPISPEHVERILRDQEFLDKATTGYNRIDKTSTSLAAVQSFSGDYDIQFTLDRLSSSGIILEDVANYNLGLSYNTNWR